MAEKYSFSNPPRLFTKALGKYLGSYESLRKEASKQKINGHSGMNYSQLLKALLSVFIEQQIEQDNIQIEQDNIRNNIFKNLVEGEKSHVSFIITEIMEFVPSVSGFRALATTSRGAFQLAYSRFNIKDKEYLKHLRLTEKAYLRYRVMSATFEIDIDLRGGRKKAMMYYHKPTTIIDQIQHDYESDESDDDYYGPGYYGYYDHTTPYNEKRNVIRNAKYGDILWYMDRLEFVIPNVWKGNVRGKTTTSEMPEEIYNLIKKQGICYKDAYNEFKERIDEWGWNQNNEEDLDFFPRYLLE